MKNCKTMKSWKNVIGRLWLFLGFLLLSCPVLAAAFVHPGVLHTEERMQQIRGLVKGKSDDAYASYLLLEKHPCAQSDYKMEGPFDTIARDGKFGYTKSRMERDFSAAYLNALMWRITGDESHARKAAEVLTAYARTLKRIPDTNDAPLLAGLEGFKIIYALEALKHTWRKMPAEDYEGALRMFTKVFLPVLETFYKRNPYTNGNWGAIVTKTYMAAAIHLDDRKMYEKAWAFYLDGYDNGTLAHYIDGETGQLQESGRDQSHCMLGLGAMATVCELAWQQGDDLYSAKDNRLLKGYEYVARYNLGYDVPFVRWTDITGKYCDWEEVSPKARGRYMYVFDIAYNHYVNRMGLPMPFTGQVLGQIRPEGYDRDQPGFGTLLFNEKADHRKFVHPGGLHTLADLERMKAMVGEGQHPWAEGWAELQKDPWAQSTFAARPMANMGDSRQKASIEAHAAYLNAIRWYISGDEAYARCAINICNAWANTVNQVPKARQDQGLLGIPIGEFAMAAEVLRVCPLWERTDFERFKEMMVEYLYPVSRDFLRTHGGGRVDYCWTNWDACNMVALAAIGVLCDRPDIYREGVEYFKHGLGNGSIRNAVPYLHRMEDGTVLGQWQESGRDQEHAQLGVGFLATFCQIAWNQGDDLFAYDGNRLLAGAEYVARHNQMRGVPFTYYNNSQGLNNRWPSVNGLGQLEDRPVWEMIYNHYEVLKGVPAPYSKRMAELLRPEHGSKDHFGYGSLTFSLRPSNYPILPVPAVPTGLRAEASIGQIRLDWEPSAEYFANGYVIQRSEAGRDDFRDVGVYKEKVTNWFIDSRIEEGKTYEYRVAAVNKAGTSRFSESVRVKAVSVTGCPSGWTYAEVGHVEEGRADYAGVQGGTYRLSCRSAAVDALSDNAPYLYRKVAGDFAVSCRINRMDGNTEECGLMLRAALKGDATAVTMTLGHWGRRFARMGYRKESGGERRFAIGNTYTWIPAWFKLARVGNVFYAYESTDGVNWFYVHSEEVEMPREIYVGVAGSFGGGKAAGSVVFDGLSIE